MTRYVFALIAVGVVMGGCGGQSPLSPGPVSPDRSDCQLFPAQASSSYVLPYAVGQASFVVRTVEHGGPQRYAIDFLRPIASVIVAARAGRVVETEAQWTDTDHTFGHENHVFVQHDDGTVARYFHLTEGGAVVELGQAVSQGQRIGLSGNSGNSTAPHLHFDVVEARCGKPWPEGPYNDRCQGTVPVTFRNTKPHACGLVSSDTYVAQPS